MLLLLSVSAEAQVSVEQKIDSMVIVLGDQTRLELSVTAPKGSKVSWPHFKRSQQITPGVEVLSQTEPDTADVDGGNIKVTGQFTLTSFDEHVYAIPGIKVKVNGKTYAGNTLALKVLTMPVDTAHMDKIYPPKDVQDNPFEWSEWAPMLWMSLLLIALCLLAFYMFVRLRQNKPVITRIRIVKRILPHEKALSEIEKIKEEHMQASEDQKEYYTKLTETLRKYIQERFGFNAMEMTSGEIIAHLQENGDRKMIDELKELFTTADLVKFAKYSTLINENDLNLVNAINFIDETKLENQPTEERIVPTLSADEQKSRHSRITIKSLLWVTGIVAAALLAYIVYRVWMLLV